MDENTIFLWPDSIGKRASVHTCKAAGNALRSFAYLTQSQNSARPKNVLKRIRAALLSVWHSVSKKNDLFTASGLRFW
jgi:hypothetical protein